MEKNKKAVAIAKIKKFSVGYINENKQHNFKKL